MELDKPCMSDLKISVVSRRKGGVPKSRSAEVVYVGRGSPLGNPFPMSKDKDQDIERARVIEEYRSWLWQKIKSNDQPVIAELERLLSWQVNLKAWSLNAGVHQRLVMQMLLRKHFLGWQCPEKRALDNLTSLWYGNSSGVFL